MHNPMSYDFVKAACQNYPEPLSRLIVGVDNFAYDSSWPVESILGEYAGDHFDKERLVLVLRRSILSGSDAESQGAHGKFSEIFNRSGLGPEKKCHIFALVEEESLKWVESRIERNAAGKITFPVGNGHHMRQYIARDSAGRFVKEILPPLWQIKLHGWLPSRELRK